MHNRTADQFIALINEQTNTKTIHIKLKLFLSFGFGHRKNLFDYFPK